MISAILADAKTLTPLIIFSLILLATDHFHFLNFPKSVLQQISTPIQYGLYKTSLSLSKQFQFIVLARRAAQENKAMVEQLAQLLSENANLRKKLAENEAFLQQQSSLSPETFQLIATRPIGISRYLIIDKGQQDGIKINQPVVYKDNLLGKINQVGSKQAQVILVSDPDSKVAAFASNKDGQAKGILKGQFEVEMLLDRVVHEEVVSEGDLVYTEGIETDMPRGLVIGQVSEVISQDNEVFKQAKVKAVFDITDLEVVFVITN